ncbi:hypothetical protein T08_11017 [Trichinella sp. T8]|nr:hypothetical protein T08_11017 [Trichinella sp. T8]
MSLPFVYLFVKIGMGPDMEHGMWNMAIRLHHQMEGRSMWFCVSQRHDLFACDGNQFGLFGSKVSLEVPVAAQFGLRAVATEDSKKRQVSIQENPEAQPGRTTQEDISIQVSLESTEDEYTGKSMKQVSIEDYKYTGKSDRQVQDIEGVHRRSLREYANFFMPWGIASGNAWG